MATEVSTSGTLSVGPARPLFDLPNSTGYWDVTPDGQQFLVAIRNPDARVTEIQVVRNWFEVLKSKFGDGDGS
jgi:hypothetical protein